MVSHDPIYAFPQGDFSVHINGNHNYVSKYKSFYSMGNGMNNQNKFFFGALLTPNISDRAKF